jgi:hypothetical protein
MISGVWTHFVFRGNGGIYGDFGWFSLKIGNLVGGDGNVKIE